MKKKLLALLLGMVVATAGFAEGQSEETSSAADGELNYDIYEGSIIELWVPAGPGTAQDTWCRFLAPELGRILKANVIIINKPGASGWVAINEFVRTKPDGQRIISSLLSQVGAGRNPSATQKINMWEDLAVLGSMMDDPGAIFISTDETRFHDLLSLIEYAKQNELVVGVTAVGSDDDVPLYWLNTEFGTKIQPVVSSGGTAQNMSDLLGGHIDFICNNIGSFSVQAKEGMLKPLVVTADERSPLFPDVPTIYEVLDGKGISVGNTRGLTMHKDTPAQYYEVMRWAFEEAVNTETVKSSFLQNGWTASYRQPDDFSNLMKEFADFINGYSDIIGWQ